VKRLFVDTAGWVAAADRDDPHGGAVRSERDQWIESGGTLITTDAVCSETLTVLRFRLGLDAAEAWWRQVEGSRLVRFESVDAVRAERARVLFFRYRDKDFSFVDCTSFVVMTELRVRHVLTPDRHFEQMKFVVLPALPASEGSGQ
jgi:predicted nucleic acid-binding protein